MEQQWSYSSWNPGVVLHTTCTTAACCTHSSKHTRSPAPASPRSVINAIVSSEEQGGGTFSHPGQARVTRVALALGKVGAVSGCFWLL